VSRRHPGKGAKTSRAELALSELCSKLGYCLPPGEQQDILRTRLQTKRRSSKPCCSQKDAIRRRWSCWPRRKSDGKCSTSWLDGRCSAVTSNGDQSLSGRASLERL